MPTEISGKACTSLEASVSNLAFLQLCLCYRKGKIFPNLSEQVFFI